MSDNVIKNSSTFGELLYNLLPEHVRNRDSGDLSQYLDITGTLLDQINHLIDSLEHDFLPDYDNSPEQSSQQWTQEYTAKLFGATLISQDPAVREKEIRNSIRWNQMKGTLRSLEEITEAMLGVESILVNSSKLVATSASLNKRVKPAEYYGEKSDTYTQGTAQTACKHPGLPSVTPFLNQISKPGKVKAITGDTQRSCFKKTNKEVYWRIHNNKGVPQYGHSAFDRSVRTVDFRKASTFKGHSFPKRINLYVPPFVGVFGLATSTVTLADNWHTKECEEEHYSVRISTGAEGRKQVSLIAKNRTLIKIANTINLSDIDLIIEGVVSTKSITLSGGNLTLKKSAFRKVTINAPESGFHAVILQDSLAENIQNCKGVTQLEQSSVLHTIVTETILATDSILGTEAMRKDLDKNAGLPSDGIIRFSQCLADKESSEKNQYRERTVFVKGDSVVQTKPSFVDEKWGSCYCGVLRRGSNDAIENGAENGGVMGAYNHRYFTRNFNALQKKLELFVPIGQEFVLIEDPNLTYTVCNKTIRKEPNS